MSENKTLQEVIQESELVTTNGSARRLICQGAVRVNGEVVRDPAAKVSSIDLVAVRGGASNLHWMVGVGDGE